MQFIGTLETANIAGVKQGTVRDWCSEKKIKGAEQDNPGSPWRIPADTVFPNGKSAATNREEAKK